MKKLMAGTMLVMVGVGIGAAVGAGVAGANARAFEVSSHIATQNDGYQLGYVAGTYDALQSITDPNINVPTGSGDRYLTWLRRQAGCLDSKGQTLGDIQAWAKYRWLMDSHQSQSGIAASTLIADACDGQAQ